MNDPQSRIATHCDSCGIFKIVTICDTPKGKLYLCKDCLNNSMKEMEDK